MESFKSFLSTMDEGKSSVKEDDAFDSRPPLVSETKGEGLLMKLQKRHNKKLDEARNDIKYTAPNGAKRVKEILKLADLWVIEIKSDDGPHWLVNFAAPSFSQIAGHNGDFFVPDKMVAIKMAKAAQKRIDKYPTRGH